MGSKSCRTRSALAPPIMICAVLTYMDQVSPKQSTRSGISRKWALDVVEIRWKPMSGTSKLRIRATIERNTGSRLSERPHPEGALIPRQKITTDRVQKERVIMKRVTSLEENDSASSECLHFAMFERHSGKEHEHGWC